MAGAPAPASQDQLSKAALLDQFLDEVASIECSTGGQR